MQVSPIEEHMSGRCGDTPLDPLRRMRVYISGQYTQGDPAENTRLAIEAGNRVLDAGMVPFVPHLSHFWHMVTPRSYEDWMAIDICFLSSCDCVWSLPRVAGDGSSPGADREETKARELGIPVFRDFEAILRYRETQSL